MKALHPAALDLDRLALDTATLADIAARHDLATPVPTCGDWDLGELAFHLYQVQHFWSHVIGNRPAGPDVYDRPERPPALADALRAGGTELVGHLMAADPADHAWSWSSDHTVGFSIRRQIHEALVHRIDGDLAIGNTLPAVAPELAADGVDELVDVMLTGIPPWATFVPSIQIVRLIAADTGDQWTMSLGSVSGTSSETGVTYDGLLAADRVADDVHADVTIGGAALDVLLWMWGRGSLEPLTVTGEAEIAADLRATVVSATQ